MPVRMAYCPRPRWCGVRKHVPGQVIVKLHDWSRSRARSFADCRYTFRLPTPTIPAGSTQLTKGLGPRQCGPTFSHEDFVYGTLKQGFGNHPATAEFAGNAHIGCPAGPGPGASQSSRARRSCMARSTVRPAARWRLDGLEGEGRMYRVKKWVRKTDVLRRSDLHRRQRDGGTRPWRAMDQRQQVRTSVPRADAGGVCEKDTL